MPSPTTHRLLLIALALAAACGSQAPTHQPTEAECKAIATNFATVAGTPGIEADFTRDCIAAPKEKWEALHCVGRAKTRADLDACAPDEPEPSK